MSGAYGRARLPRAGVRGPLAGPGGTRRVDAAPQGGAPREDGGAAPITGVVKTVVRDRRCRERGDPRIYMGSRISAGNPSPSFPGGPVLPFYMANMAPP